MQSYFYQAHLPPAGSLAVFLCMHPSCLCCCYLLIGFVFWITRTNLIRAKGIQISFQPPNTIWSSNKGLRERKEGRNYKRAFGSWRELLEKCESLNKLIQFLQGGLQTIIYKWTQNKRTVCLRFRTCLMSLYVSMYTHVYCMCCSTSVS